MWTVLALFFFCVGRSQGLNVDVAQSQTSISRRKFVESSAIFGAVTLSPRGATAAPSSIANRFDSDVLKLPPITAGTKFTGHENLVFPEFMEGEWDAVQTLVSTKAPLGLKFIGGPQASLDVAQKTMDEQAKRVNEQVNLKLRFVKTNFGVSLREY